MQSLKSFGTKTTSWADTKFEMLDAETMGTEVGMYSKTVLACERQLPSVRPCPQAQHTHITSLRLILGTSVLFFRV